MNHEFLKVYNSGSDGYHVAHEPTREIIARFRTLTAACKFRAEIEDADWDFTDPKKTPVPTWIALKDAFERRGIKLQVSDG